MTETNGNSDTLRPQSWDEYIGQERLKEELEIRIAAATAQHRPLDHMLLYGPAGSGKTSLAHVIASRMHDPVECVTMPITPKALTQLVRTFQGVLILDEVHRAPDARQEDLLPLLEFGYVQSPSGQKYQSEFLTVIGTTTEPQDIITPLYDRFLVPDIDPYSEEEIARIAQSMAAKANVVLGEEDALIIGKAAGGVPRRARHLVLAMRDLAAAHGKPATALEALEMCRTDVDGLTVMHTRYLEILSALGGTAGLKTLASLLQLNEGFVSDNERLLINQGLITRGDRGREITGKGAKKLRTLHAA